MSIIFWQHPEYLRNKAKWQMYRDLYEGEHTTLVSSNYLWPHHIESKGAEGNTLRSLREQRTRYFNIPEVIISLWLSLFFKCEPEWGEKTTELMGEAIANVDGKGTNFFSFIKNQFTANYLKYGKAICNVDAFPGGFRTKADQNAAGFRPYLQTIDPLELVDWELENVDSLRFGALNFARYEYFNISPRANASAQPQIEARTTVYARENNKFTAAYYKRVKKEVNSSQNIEPHMLTNDNSTWETASELIQTDLDELPIVLLEDESWIKDVCEETLRHHNLRSSKDNILHTQGFQDKFVKGLMDEKALQAFSEHVYKILPENGDVITVDPVDLTPYENAIADALEAAFKVGLNQLRQLPANSKAAQAADSISQEKENTYALVESTLEEIETAARQMVNLWAKFTGKDDFECDLELNKEIKDEDWNAWVTTYQAFADSFRKVPTVQKAAVKKAVEKLDLFSSDEESSAAMKEIDGAQFGDQQQGQSRQDLLTNIIGNGSKRTTPNATQGNGRTN